MMRRKSHKKPPVEFSKKILIAAAIINLGVIVFACVMIYKTMDLSPLAYLVPAVAAEVATGTGFYYNKAKMENRIKLMKKNDVQPNESHFNEY